MCSKSNPWFAYQLFHVTDSGGYQAGNPVDRATGELPNELKDAQCFLDSYKNVFNGELGCLAGAERLEVNPEVVPVKMPLRKVPISVQNRLEEEIRRLETLGVIEKITEPTDWVSGLVVAEKKMGNSGFALIPSHSTKHCAEGHTQCQLWRMCCLVSTKPRYSRCVT